MRTAQKTFVISSLATFGILLAFNKIYAPLPGGSADILTLELAWNAAHMQALLLSWGANGIHLVLSTFWLDYLFPIAYACFLSTGLKLVFQKKGRSHPCLMGLTTLPFAAMAFDFLENITLCLLIAGRISLTDNWVWTASVFATIKWGLIGLSLLALWITLLTPKKTS